MQGWFKLIEKIRQTSPHSDESIRSSSQDRINNNLGNNILAKKQQTQFEKSVILANTNGHVSKSFETINTLDSPTNIFHSPSIISLGSTPGQNIEDVCSNEFESMTTLRSRRESIPLVELESTTTTAASSPTSSGLLNEILFFTNNSKISIKMARPNVIFSLNSES